MFFGLYRNRSIFASASKNEYFWPKNIDFFSDPSWRRGKLFNQNVVYGFGHVYNDLCAAMWFSYMMLFFQAVLDMRAAVAGAMLLLGIFIRFVFVCTFTFDICFRLNLNKYLLKYYFLYLFLIAQSHLTNTSLYFLPR